MKTLVAQIIFFAISLLLITWVSFFLVRRNYEKEATKLDEPTRIAWKNSLWRFSMIGTGTAILVLIIGIYFYMADKGGGYGSSLQIFISFPIILIGVTMLSAIGAYAFLTYKLQEHQINGNEQYAKDVKLIRTQVMALFYLFLIIQSIFLISKFL